MFDVEFDDYDDTSYYNEEEAIRIIKIQKLIKKGVDPSRIRNDGTYVMTKDEFMTAITNHYKKRKASEYKNKNKTTKESDYMSYLTKVFEKRKKRTRRY